MAVIGGLLGTMRTTGTHTTRKIAGYIKIAMYILIDIRTQQMSTITIGMHEKYAEEIQ